MGNAPVVETDGFEPVETTRARPGPGQMSFPGILAHLRFEDHAGPLPHPDILVAYEHIVPGSARQLMDNFLAEGGHRRALQQRVIDDSSAARRTGVWLALLLALLLIGIGAAATFTNHDVVAGIIFAGGIAGVVLTFIVSRLTQARTGPPPPSGSST